MNTEPNALCRLCGHDEHNADFCGHTEGNWGRCDCYGGKTEERNRPRTRDYDDEGNLRSWVGGSV